MVLQNPPDNPSVRHDRFANRNIRLINSRRRKLQNAEQIAKNTQHQKPPQPPPSSASTTPVRTTTPTKTRTRSLPTQKPTASEPDATPYRPRACSLQNSLFAASRKRSRALPGERSSESVLSYSEIWSSTSLMESCRSSWVGSDGFGVCTVFLVSFELGGLRILGV